MGRASPVELGRWTPITRFAPTYKIVSTSAEYVGQDTGRKDLVLRTGDSIRKPESMPAPPKPTKGKLEDRPVEPDIQEASPYDANTIQVQSSHSEADRDGASFLHLTLGSGRRMNYVRRASVF